MENKIICNIQPFLMNQKIFVVREGKVTEVTSTFDNLPKDIAFYADTLKIYNIVLKRNGFLGPADDIRDDILKIMSTEYNNNSTFIAIE